MTHTVPDGHFNAGDVFRPAACCRWARFVLVSILEGSIMGLLNNLKKNGATIHSVTVSSRDKDSGEAVRSIPLPGAGISALTDRKVMLRAIAASAEKSVAVQVTEGVVTRSGKTDPIEVAKSFAEDMGEDELFIEFIAMQSAPQLMDSVRASLASQFAAERRTAEDIRKAMARQAMTKLAAESADIEEPATV